MAYAGVGWQSDAVGKVVLALLLAMSIDVMLVLLVIFIVTAPLLTHAVKIDLPQATSQPNVA